MEKKSRVLKKQSCFVVRDYFNPEGQLLSRMIEQDIYNRAVSSRG